ncbi:hypothetical protein JIN84_11780 [Luteolibacter yonseiensis]|uniref:Uncharacterized protein n=1 Tax=Luteolibacter yonseiensis TaxID=1144680 RepID=A0A934R6U6_9BACT|nr:hypothetical protein [Luteolibacter yonseiensis]MBK1816295.1 hypothetical protein [Luteolibacter yonseiensis]
MKILVVAVLCSILGGCAPALVVNQEKFEAAPSSIDSRLDSASIEDYIIALPLHHEGGVEQFEEQVRLARVEKAENLGKGPDYLFVGGDGVSPARGFGLDRRKRLLTIRSYEWEPGFPDTMETMRRVPGGWMRGPSIVVKTAEQKAAEEAKQRTKRG